MEAISLPLRGKLALEFGLTTLIDEEDFSLVSKHKWAAQRTGSSDGKSYFYASTRINGKTVLLHRFLAGAGKGDVVDHRNHDTLDNRRKNLRVCSHAQNMQNRIVARSSKSGVKGVFLNPRSGNYRARIRVNGKAMNLGSFPSVEAAAEAYRAAAVKYHGEFACFGVVEKILGESQPVIQAVTGADPIVFG